MRCPRPCLTAAVSLLLLLSVAGCRTRSRTEARELRPSGAPALSIDLPPEYNIERRAGVDFEVFYIQRARTEHGDPPKDGMGIYFGRAPNFSPPSDARTLTGAVAGRKVTWYAWQDESSDRTLLRMQALVPGLFAPDKEKAGVAAGLQVHIFLWAPGEKRLGILHDAAESLRLK